MKDESGKLATNKNGLAMTRKLKKNTALMALSNKNKTTKHTKNSKKKRCALMSTKKRKRGKKIQLRKKKRRKQKKIGINSDLDDITMHVNDANVTVNVVVGEFDIHQRARRR